MFFMHKLSSILIGPHFSFFMALETLSLRDMPITLNDIQMARLTSHSSGNIFPMVETPTFNFNVPFGFDVARSATPNGT
jgi:hypothetical protein